MTEPEKLSKRAPRTEVSSAQLARWQRERTERKKEAAEWEERSAAAQRSASDWRRRWSLSLAIGHGAGLLGVGTILLDNKKRPPGWELLLLPSGWCFLLGLVLAGTIPLLWSMAHRRERDWAWVVAREREAGGPTDLYMAHEEPEFSETLRQSFRARQKRLERYIDWVEGVAAVAFVAALLIPLAQFSFHGFADTSVVPKTESRNSSLDEQVR